ncbi:DeoR/GlpR family DNA-binding transcription regulator [Primorskyibacter sp. S187A]|uniref:DeoR/GlpR family DNA-binding transcription regulator n=1 Tax=Primorskyibacter sp. S187A TaxID=3415130 RepID=UPI003C7D348E
MGQTLRKPEIIEIARREGKVTVERLVAYFGVTPQTIRRDLTELSEDGQLERVHGGAVLPSTTMNIDYIERQQLNQSSKLAIARECVRHIPNDCSLFLNIGTTTEAVAAELHSHTGLLVVTNNLNIANRLGQNPNVEVAVTGGNLRAGDGGLVGPIAREAISRFRFDFAVIGCSALHPRGDILDFDMREVGVSQAIIERSDKVLLVADHSKFERKAPIKIATMGEIDTFVTNQLPPSLCRETCAASDTQVIVTENS